MNAKHFGAAYMEKFEFGRHAIVLGIVNHKHNACGVDQHYQTMSVLLMSKIHRTESLCKDCQFPLF